jgi:hypothetical protein
MASDPRYPIDLAEPGGRLVVLDGFHRLLQTAMEGRPEIDAMVLSRKTWRRSAPREARDGTASRWSL